MDDLGNGEYVQENDVDKELNMEVEKEINADVGRDRCAKRSGNGVSRHRHLKSILKGACEDRKEPVTIEKLVTTPVPRTNPINVIFLLSTYAP